MECKHGRNTEDRIICILCKNEKLENICRQQDIEITRLRSVLQNIRGQALNDSKQGKHLVLSLHEISKYIETEMMTPSSESEG